MHALLLAVSLLGTAPEDGIAAPAVPTSAPTAPGESAVSPAPPATGPATEHPYAGPIAIADAAAWGIVLTGAAVGSPYVLGLGATSLFLAAPLVHVAAGHPGRGLASLGLRLGGFFVAGLIGAKVNQHEEDSGDPDAAYGHFLDGFAAGAPIGLVTAEIIDIFALGGIARKSDARTADAGGLTAAPVIALGPGGGFVGVAAVF